MYVGIISAPYAANMMPIRRKRKAIHRIICGE
jgi:hypothetical protein